MNFYKTWKYFKYLQVQKRTLFITSNCNEKNTVKHFAADKAFGKAKAPVFVESSW